MNTNSRGWNRNINIRINNTAIIDRAGLSGISLVDIPVIYSIIASIKRSTML